MRNITRALIAGACLVGVVGLASLPQARPFHGGAASSGGGSSTTLALTRDFNQPSGTSTPANAFWMIGQPIKDGDVPSGNIVTATLGGSAVKVRGCEVKQRANGDAGWMWLLVDYSGQTITPGSSKSLVLTSTSGSWGSSTGRTTADWQALNDTTTLTSLSTSGTSAADMDGSGTWTASFDANSTVHTLCTNDEGRIDEVVAPFVNTSAISSISLSSITWSGGLATFTTSSPHGIAASTVFQAKITGASPSGYNGNFSGCTRTGTSTFTCPIATNPGTNTVAGTFQQAHRFLQARMFYWVTQKTDGSLGPIASLGPFIEHLQILNTDLSEFGYTANWVRNGVTQRSQASVTQPAMTSSILSRSDGQWDWSANDPQVWVGADYNLVRATKRITPYLTGVTYNGANPAGGSATVPITGVNTTTGVLTVASIGGLSNTSIQKATAIEFGGTSAPTGITFGQIYWGCYSGTTIKVYNTFAAANTCTGTGQVVPSTSGSGVYAMAAAAPQSVGVVSTSLGDPGERPDIGFQSEWAGAYIVGNTQGWQRLGRISAYNIWSLPAWALNSATGCQFSFLPTSLTPSSGANCMGGTGMGTGYGLNLEWGSGPGAIYYNDVGVPNTSGTGVWALSGTDEHMPHSAWNVWLMEANPYLRELMYQQGSKALASSLYPYGRNPQLPGGTQYYGSFFTYCNQVVRQCAWSLRSVVLAAFAAPTGSAEETYYKTLLQQTTAALADYREYQGTNYKNLGLTYNYDNFGGYSFVYSGQQIYYPNFMHTYMNIAVGMADAIMGDQVPALHTINGYIATITVGMHNVNCGYFSTAYNLGVSRTPIGGAAPATFISSIADLGYGDAAWFPIVNGNSSITPVGQGVGTLGDTTLKGLVIGSKYRPMNYDSNTGTGGGPYTVVGAPSPFVDGTDYTITGVSGSTFTTAVTPSADATYAGGIIVPSGATGANCPAGSTNGGVTGGPIAPSNNDYLSEQIAGLGVAAATGGTAGASTAYDAAVTRQNRSGNSIYSNGVVWALQKTF